MTGTLKCIKGKKKEEENRFENTLPTAIYVHSREMSIVAASAALICLPWTQSHKQCAAFDTIFP